MDWNRVRCHIF